MAFNLKKFGKSDCNDNSNLPQAYAYDAGADALSAVQVSGYIDEPSAVRVLKVGTRVNLSNDAGEHGYAIVLSNDGTTVDLSDVVSEAGLTDSD